MGDRDGRQSEASGSELAQRRPPQHQPPSSSYSSSYQPRPPRSQHHSPHPSRGPTPTHNYSDQMPHHLTFSQRYNSKPYGRGGGGYRPRNFNSYHGGGGGRYYNDGNRTEGVDRQAQQSAAVYEAANSTLPSGTSSPGSTSANTTCSSPPPSSSCPSPAPSGPPPSSSHPHHGYNHYGHHYHRGYHGHHGHHSGSYRPPFHRPDPKDIQPSDMLIDIMQNPTENFFHGEQQSAAMMENTNHRRFLSFELKRKAEIERCAKLYNTIPKKLDTMPVDPLRITITMEVNSADYYELFTKRALRATKDDIRTIMEETKTLIQFPDRTDDPEYMHQVTITGHYANVETARLRLRDYTTITVMYSLLELKDGRPTSEHAEWLQKSLEEFMTTFKSLHIELMPPKSSSSSQMPIVRVVGRLAEESLVIEACEKINEMCAKEFLDLKSSFASFIEVPRTQRTLLVGVPDGYLSRTISVHTKAILHFPSCGQSSGQTSMFYITAETPQSVLKARRFLQGLRPTHLCFDVSDSDLEAPIEPSQRYMNFYDKNTHVGVRVMPSSLEPNPLLPTEQKRHYIALTGQEYHLQELHTVYRRILKVRNTIRRPKDTYFEEMDCIKDVLIAHSVDYDSRCRIEPFRGVGSSVLNSVDEDKTPTGSPNATTAEEAVTPSASTESHESTASTIRPRTDQIAAADGPGTSRTSMPSESHNDVDGSVAGPSQQPSTSCHQQRPMPFPNLPPKEVVRAALLAQFLHARRMQAEMIANSSGSPSSSTSGPTNLSAVQSLANNVPCTSTPSTDAGQMSSIEPSSSSTTVNVPPPGVVSYGSTSMTGAVPGTSVAAVPVVSPSILTSATNTNTTSTAYSKELARGCNVGPGSVPGVAPSPSVNGQSAPAGSMMPTLLPPISPSVISMVRAVANRQMAQLPPSGIFPTHLQPFQLSPTMMSQTQTNVQQSHMNPTTGPPPGVPQNPQWNTTDYGNRTSFREQRERRDSHVSVREGGGFNNVGGTFRGGASSDSRSNSGSFQPFRGVVVERSVTPSSRNSPDSSFDLNLSRDSDGRGSSTWRRHDGGRGSMRGGDRRGGRRYNSGSFHGNSSAGMGGFANPTSTSGPIRKHELELRPRDPPQSYNSSYNRSSPRGTPLSAFIYPSSQRGSPNSANTSRGSNDENGRYSRQQQRYYGGDFRSEAPPPTPHHQSHYNQQQHSRYGDQSTNSHAGVYFRNSPNNSPRISPAPSNMNLSRQSLMDTHCTPRGSENQPSFGSYPPLTPSGGVNSAAMHLSRTSISSSSSNPNDMKSSPRTERKQTLAPKSTPRMAPKVELIHRSPARESPMRCDAESASRSSTSNYQIAPICLPPMMGTYAQSSPTAFGHRGPGTFAEMRSQHPPRSSSIHDYGPVPLMPPGLGHSPKGSSSGGVTYVGGFPPSMTSSKDGDSSTAIRSATVGQQPQSYADAAKRIDAMELIMLVSEDPQSIERNREMQMRQSDDERPGSAFNRTYAETAASNNGDGGASSNGGCVDGGQAATSTSSRTACSRTESDVSTAISPVPRSPTRHPDSSNAPPPVRFPSAPQRGVDNRSTRQPLLPTPPTLPRSQSPPIFSADLLRAICDAHQRRELRSVKEVLKLIDHGHVSPLFMDRKIDLEQFSRLNDDDLKKIGINSMSSRHRILDGISCLRKALRANFKRGGLH